MAKQFGAKPGRRSARSIPYQNPHPDPLAHVEYADNLESDSKAELEAVDQAFRARRKQEDKRYQHAVDASYWAGLCFHSRDDLEAFLSAIGMDQAMFRGRYINGYDLARALGVEVEFDNEKE